MLILQQKYSTQKANCYRVFSDDDLALVVDHIDSNDVTLFKNVPVEQCRTSSQVVAYCNSTAGQRIAV